MLFPQTVFQVWRLPQSISSALLYVLAHEYHRPQGTLATMLTRSCGFKTDNNVKIKKNFAIKIKTTRRGIGIGIWDMTVVWLCNKKCDCLSTTWPVMQLKIRWLIKSQLDILEDNFKNKQIKHKKQNKNKGNNTAG